jgi:hypothetical protein
MENTAADGVVEPAENAPKGDAAEALTPLREPAGVPRTGALEVKGVEAGVSSFVGISFPSPLL